ncbi:glycosyltransferase family 4 protein [Flavobacterium pectinovorum]|uniref:glycosyltransferase family 4 protein n=1 Tax=Flavobacterium pectinovorum TaxID=29533 RepID=UPI00265DB713|nr:glycosyltransferase family 4 protein [Flavobacterium pectinovorum]WKL45992.1 glycosyltransferase family 4 protein [Flavobacterium pectinovorum]
MKIIYTIHGTCNPGGMERVLINKVNYLANLPNYDVYIITSGQRGRAPFYEISSKVKCIDLDVNYSETIEGNPIIRLYDSAIKHFRHKSRLKKKLFELKADIVVSMFTNDVDFLHKIKDGSRKILEIHFSRGFRLLKDRKGIMRLVDVYMTYLNDRIVAKYDRFVVLTHQDRESWKSKKNISVIYNAVPNGDNKIVSSLDNKKALAIGRIVYQKNMELLVDLWAEISKKHPDWILTIVCVGNSIELQEKIKSKSLDKIINLVPSTNSIEDYYIESSLYLMTSRFEGLPMVLLEAQNYGLPIVSFDCECGPREIINHKENGYIIEETNETDFVEKVSMILENETLRKEFGSNAKTNSLKFSEENIMQQWLELFKEVTNENTN